MRFRRFRKRCRTAFILLGLVAALADSALSAEQVNDDHKAH